MYNYSGDGICTVIAATLDGSLGYLLPLPETTFRRLKMLQIKLVQGLPHNAGLNPKAFRSVSFY